MPNGYGSMQIYFPVHEADLLHFLQEMGRGERSAYVREAIKLKRAMNGEETLVVAAVRRVIREELSEFSKTLAKNAPTNFGENFETFSDEGGDPDADDLADFVGRNTF